MRGWPGLRLPKALDERVDVDALVRTLAAQARPLWAESALDVPEVAWTPALAQALRSAHAGRRLVRGLEDARAALAAEAQGLAHVDRKTGVTRGARVSRVIVVTNDGAERFYRQLERILVDHMPRAVAIQLDTDAETLGRAVLGGSATAKLLLCNHKDATSAVLTALTASSR